MSRLVVAVVGSRAIDSFTQSLAAKIIWDEFLKNHQGPIFIRSGNAQGMDQTVNLLKDKVAGVIHYLPWESYNQELRIKQYNMYYVHKPEFFGRFSSMLAAYGLKDATQGVNKLMFRNYQIVLGQDGTNHVSKLFYLCATEKLSGGTRHAVKCAKDNGIEVINLYPYIVSR